MKNTKQSGIKQMWEFKVSTAKFVKYLNDNIIPVNIPKDVKSDWLYGYVTSIVIETIKDFDKR